MIQDQSGKEQSKIAKNQQAEPITEQINKFVEQSKREEQSIQEGKQVEKVELFVSKSLASPPNSNTEQTERKMPQLVGPPVRLNMELFQIKPKRTLRDLPITNFGSTDDDAFNPLYRNQRQTINNQQYPQDNQFEIDRTIKRNPVREKTFLLVKENRDQWYQIQVYTEDNIFQYPQNLIVKGQSEADDDNDSDDKEIVHAQGKLGGMNSCVIQNFLQPQGQGFPHGGVKNWPYKFNDWTLE